MPATSVSSLLIFKSKKGKVAPTRYFKQPFELVHDKMMSISGVHTEENWFYQQLVDHI
jgi:hypothetical protein